MQQRRPAGRDVPADHRRLLEAVGHRNRDPACDTTPRPVRDRRDLRTCRWSLHLESAPPPSGSWSSANQISPATLTTTPTGVFSELDALTVLVVPLLPTPGKVRMEGKGLRDGRRRRGRFPLHRVGLTFPQRETLSFPAVRTEPAGFGNSELSTVGRAWLYSVPGRGGGPVPEANRLLLMRRCPDGWHRSTRLRWPRSGTLPGRPIRTAAPGTYPELWAINGSVS